MDYAQISKHGTRDNNEDSIEVLETENGTLFVIADGLGGHGRGEVASALAVETFVLNFSDYIGEIEEYLPQAFLSAQSNIRDAQISQKASSEMKTTCAALLISDDICRIGHVGDTRVYVFNKNKIKIRTRDHSVPEMLVMSGEISERKIRSHPDRNRLLRTMGIEWESPQFEIAEDIQVSLSQAFLLCTDGFWELCNEKKMCVALKKSNSATEWLDLMTIEVEKNGINKDMDNYSAIAVILR
ncbi:MAG: protein phosphatase 2C domain-containing protein [Oscillospiraceae bacterium]|jgi:serine/threonine protein phosphatase PrpC|nr:protein phosphatase 2C domain-containing protein [Oscillospiraceae bacterium]